MCLWVRTAVLHTAVKCSLNIVIVMLLQHFPLQLAVSIKTKSHNTCKAKSHAIAGQVLGNGKGVVAVIISVLWFQNPVSLYGLAGYGVTVSGVIAYSQACPSVCARWGTATPALEPSMTASIVRRNRADLRHHSLISAHIICLPASRPQTPHLKLCMSA